MNKLLTKLRRDIQNKLKTPTALLWHFDSQDRGGEPFRVFLNLAYLTKVVVIEWRYLWADQQFIVTCDQEQFIVTSPSTTIARTISLLEGNHERP